VDEQLVKAGGDVHFRQMPEARELLLR